MIILLILPSVNSKKIIFLLYIDNNLENSFEKVSGENSWQM